MMTIKYILYLNFFPIFNILAVYIPKNSKKVGTCKYNNHKLRNFVKLYNDYRLHDGVSTFILIFLHVLLQLFTIIFADNMLKILNIEQLK